MNINCPIEEAMNPSGGKEWLAHHKDWVEANHNHWPTWFPRSESGIGTALCSRIMDHSRTWISKTTGKSMVVTHPYWLTSDHLKELSDFMAAHPDIEVEIDGRSYYNESHTLSVKFTHEGSVKGDATKEAISSFELALYGAPALQSVSAAEIV